MVLLQALRPSQGTSLRVCDEIDLGAALPTYLTLPTALGNRGNGGNRILSPSLPRTLPCLTLDQPPFLERQLSRASKGRSHHRRLSVRWYFKERTGYITLLVLVRFEAKIFLGPFDGLGRDGKCTSVW